MSQWNALNVNVIKTKKIECAKLNLPSSLTRSPDKKSSPSLKSASTHTENLNSANQDCKQLISKNHSSGEISYSLGHFSTEDSTSAAEDEVFQESFETPPEENSSFSKSSTKRRLSLPTYLSSDHFYSIQPDVFFRPRRLFEEALNLESYSDGPQRNKLNSRVDNQDPGNHIFPREQEKTQNSIHKRKQSRTSHAGRMKRVEASSPIICDDNNNIDYDLDNLESTIQSKSCFNVRDWEQRVLVLTSDYEFGTESSKKPRDECDTRSRSVALTGNISTIANDKTTDQNQSKRQVKSETKSEMPKLQTVVWDYIKRKSTKRKRKNESSHSEKQENLRSENQESSSENVEKSTCNDVIASDAKSCDASFAVVKISRNDPGNLFDKSGCSRPIKSWKSAPNLNSTCVSEVSENLPLRRYDSFNHLFPGKSPPKLPAKQLEINSQSLTFLLTTASEEKPMDERMQTLKLSREWLLKELKSMREEDRRLARQFINLRSAIVEMREFCEKEELDYDSESEQKTIEPGRKDNKRSPLIERKIAIHDTPTRNILGYC